MLQGVTWTNLDSIRLPPLLGEIIAANLKTPPLVMQQGTPLSGAPIDHLALAVQSPKQLLDTFEDLLLNNARVIETPRVWPDADGCLGVPWQDRKLMATAAVREGLCITLLASMARGDVLSRFLDKVGRAELHHVAFLVKDIHSCLVVLKAAIPDLQQITIVAEDAPMSQVFVKVDPDNRIMELVERRTAFAGFFTCKNVAALTAGERQHSNRGEVQQEGNLGR